MSGISKHCWVLLRAGVLPPTISNAAATQVQGQPVAPPGTPPTPSAAPVGHITTRIPSTTDDGD